MAREPNLSVVIPTRDTRSLVLACLESLERDPTVTVEVVVVDDGSTDDTASAVAERFPAVRVLRNDASVGFSASVNHGLAEASGDLVLLLNSDTEVERGALAKAVETLAVEERIGVLGAQLLYPDGESQWSGGREPSLLWLFALASHLARASRRRSAVYRRSRSLGTAALKRVDWVSGAAMLVRREVLAAEGLDDGYRFYCQDLELCSRARRQGWQVAIEPAFRVIHHQGATSKRVHGHAETFDPREEILWQDLLRWARRHRSRSFTATARATLRAGASLRWLALRLHHDAAGAAALARAVIRLAPPQIR